MYKHCENSKFWRIIRVFMYKSLYKEKLRWSNHLFYLDFI